MIFKKSDLVFLSNKNIIIKKLYIKLNNKMFDLFKIKVFVNFSYKLKLSKIINIYNVFYFKFLILAIINLLLNRKNSFFIIIIIKEKKK